MRSLTVEDASTSDASAIAPIRAEHDRHAADLRVDLLYLARVHAGSDPSPRGRTASAIARASHGPSRSVEGRKEAVAGRVDLGATVPREQATNGRVMALEEPTPAPVAEFHGRRGRVHDVGEQHGRQHPIEFGGLSLELTNERHDGVREIVLPPEVRTLEFDQLRAGDVVGEVGRVLAGKYGIARSVDDGRRDADRREDLTNVRRPVDLPPRERVARRARVSPEGRHITDRVLVIEGLGPDEPAPVRVSSNDPQSTPTCAISSAQDSGRPTDSPGPTRFCAAP